MHCTDMHSVEPNGVVLLHKMPLVGGLDRHIITLGGTTATHVYQAPNPRLPAASLTHSCATNISYFTSPITVLVTHHSSPEYCNA